MKRLPVVPFVALLAILTVGPAEPKISIILDVSPPANGSYFVVGERPVVSVILPPGIGREDFSRLRLYVYGPQAATRTVTAARLLKASTDRSAEPHHYIDLVTEPAATVNGNVLTYSLQAVSNEEPGTYTASLCFVSSDDPLEQAMLLADFQIGTDTVETPLVDKSRCARCHLGADNGQFYHHHVDPSPAAPFGEPALDSWPVRTCKSCHNLDGYAAFTDPADGSTQIPDPLVKRVHGVHMGRELKNPLNTDPNTGVFRSYVNVGFPFGVRGTTVSPYSEIPGVKNCTVCHIDDRWKTNPSRLACGGCHDNIWWGPPAAVPRGYYLHSGGQRDDDLGCSFCHPPDTGGIKPIAKAHEVAPHRVNRIDISMTPPANGQYYTAADDVVGVVITLTIKDDSGNPIVHTDVTDVKVSAANLFVYGPREHARPVLTNSAINGVSKLRASVTNSIAATGSPAGWTFAPGDMFTIAANGRPALNLRAPVGLKNPDNVVAWLNASFSIFRAEARASRSGTDKVMIESLIRGGESSRIDIYDSAVATIMGWKPAGVITEPYVNVGQALWQGNDLRDLILADPAWDYVDPDVTRNAKNITYTLRGKFGELTAGTYCVYAYFVPKAGRFAGFNNPVAFALTTFQVGTATAEEKVATNCTDCHGDSIMHLYESQMRPAPFDPDYCKACHDYAHYNTGDGFANQGGTSTSGWSGFGAVPIARKVHGVHFGKYLTYPERISAEADGLTGVIFPQDVRNCTKCHAEGPKWRQEPSRIACLACHDGEEARYHGTQMTQDPTPDDPYGGDEVETCRMCHASDADFSADKVHNISDPYKPPYLRDPDRNE